MGNYCYFCINLGYNPPMAKKDKKPRGNLIATDRPANAEIPKPMREGILAIGELRIPCAVLPGSVRVLSQRGTLSALDRSPKQSSGHVRDQLPGFLRANNLAEFVTRELLEALSPVEYQPLSGGRTALGIRAEALPMVCEAYLNARDAGVLTKSQLPTAERCRRLQNGFARLGIVALVDGATGYYEGAARALAEIFETFLVKEKAREWIHTFPLEFYEEIYRLKGWSWRALANGKKPRTRWEVAKITDDVVYRRIAPGVLRELRRRNPHRNVRHHQLFNEEHGHPRLREHLAGVMALMRASSTWADFKKVLDMAYPRQLDEDSLVYKDNVPRLPKKH